MDDFNNNSTPVPQDGEDKRQTQPAQQAAPEQPEMQAQSAAEEQPPVEAQNMRTEDEPRTPYQTPVQHPSYQPPQQDEQTAAEQPQQNRWTEDAPQHKHGKKRSGVAVGLCGVAAACLLFAGGAVIGHLVSGGSGSADSGTVAAAGNMPTVQISSTPQSDPADYDVKDGLPGEEIYKKVSPSIVSVIVTSAAGGGSGSGVIMTADGYIITNNHVVEDAQKVVVQLNSGTQLPANVIGLDEKTDLAVLKVEPTDELTPAEFGDSDALQPGEYAYAIGSPGGVELANTITGGRISAINRDITIDDRVMTLIQTDASINPGNSGGALINKYGQVVGITSAKLGISYYEGLGFAIPMSTAKEIVDELISTGYIAGRPSIGITGRNISQQQAQASNLPQGVYVASVDERAHAAQQGLQVGDIITAVEGKTITTMDEINAIKEEKKAGDTLEISVYRMSTGKILTFNITLTDEHDLSDDNSSQQQNQQSQYGEGGWSQYGQGQDPFSYFFGGW